MARRGNGRGRVPHPNHARHCRKSKLKARYHDNLDAELAWTLERAEILRELVWERDHPPEPKPAPVKAPRPAKQPRYNSWGMELH